MRGRSQFAYCVSIFLGKSSWEGSYLSSPSRSTSLGPLPLSAGFPGQREKIAIFREQAMTAESLSGHEILSQRRHSGSQPGFSSSVGERAPSGKVIVVEEGSALRHIGALGEAIPFPLSPLKQPPGSHIHRAHHRITGVMTTECEVIEHIGALI